MTAFRTSLFAAPLALAALGLAACGGPAETTTTESASATSETSVAMAETSATSGAATQATATLQTAQGEAAGTATATSAAGGVSIALNVTGMPVGEHGVHVHTTGRCDPPAFTTAGPHWNPTEAKHGLENPQGQHAGDMPNLTVAADGTGTLSYTLKNADFAGLLDADGAAFIVHAKADDQTTDPSGDSGDRIACGVFAAG